MKPLRARLPGEHIVVYAYGSLALGLIKRFYRSGADVVVANVDPEDDFRSLRDAVRRRCGYKTEAIRNALDNEDNEKDLLYAALSSKLRRYAWYTIQGFSVKEIADMMHVTASTVTMMRKRALDILGIGHASQLIHDGTRYEHGMK